MLENADEIREDKPGYGIRASRMIPSPPGIRALAGGRTGASYFFDYRVGADGGRSIVVEDYGDRRVVTGITIEPSTDCWPWR